MQFVDRFNASVDSPSAGKSLENARAEGDEIRATLRVRLHCEIPSRLAQRSRSIAGSGLLTQSRSQIVESRQIFEMS